MTKIISYNRRICDIGDCNRPTRNKGFYKGKVRYDRVCGWHHSISTRPYFQERKLKIPNTKCEVCGWDKTYCDRHRIIPSLGYSKDNVKVLCPNCHRLVTNGLLKI